MVTPERAHFIAHDWIDAWNDRDADRMIQYYDKSIKHTSPLAVPFADKGEFTVKGIRSMKEYFLEGMNRFKDVYFELMDIMVGADSISIIYKTTKDRKAMETLFLNDEGKVCRSYAYYDD